MDEFGEFPAYYIWPLHHINGDPFPEDFHERVWNALRDAGLDCESV